MAQVQPPANLLIDALMLTAVAMMLTRTLSLAAGPPPTVASS
ncbi:hypothetical protein [Amycolatopsis sp.]|nr:hypothetical protein [Amycolatopsis sp.]